MAKSRTSRAADVSSALGVEEARNPLALMTSARSATRISAAMASDVTVRLLIGLSPRQPATRSSSALRPQKDTPSRKISQTGLRSSAARPTLPFDELLHPDANLVADRSHCL